jgi:hypothetical protein
MAGVRALARHTAAARPSPWAALPRSLTRASHPRRTPWPACNGGEGGRAAPSRRSSRTLARAAVSTALDVVRSCAPSTFQSSAARLVLGRVSLAAARASLPYSAPASASRRRRCRPNLCPWRCGVNGVIHEFLHDGPNGG